MDHATPKRKKKHSYCWHAVEFPFHLDFCSIFLAALIILSSYTRGQNILLLLFLFVVMVWFISLQCCDASRHKRQTIWRNSSQSLLGTDILLLLLHRRVLPVFLASYTCRCEWHFLHRTCDKYGGTVSWRCFVTLRFKATAEFFLSSSPPFPSLSRTSSLCWSPQRGMCCSERAFLLWNNRTWSGPWNQSAGLYVSLHRNSA